ncbi:hypothetical protein [Fuerstiella marisgermanici]|nr:hypothetical protein [Fuerstiella marisgermanici]
MSERKYEVTMDNTGGPTYFTVQDDKKQIVHSGVTPKQVTLPAKGKWLLPAKYDVTYAGRDGVEQHRLKARLDWWTAGNLVLGGVVGIAADVATGAMWRLDDRVTGQVTAQNVVSNESEGGAVLANWSRRNSQNSATVASYETNESYAAPTANEAQPIEVRQASFGLAQQR